MNSLVLYYHPGRLRGEYSPVFCEEHHAGSVRAELHEGKNVTEALDAAAPRPGETVLNSVEIPESGAPI